MKAKSIKNVTIKELEKELARRYKNKEIKEIKNLKIGGITTKDFLVLCGDLHSIGKLRWSFYLVRDGKEYDIYYESHGKDWWPTENEENAAFNFIPGEFAEACENSFEFDGTESAAIKLLKQYGFCNFRRFIYQ